MKKKAVLFIMSLILLSPMFGETAYCTESTDGTNLALGKTYTIESGAANDFSYGQTEKGSKTQLTDGKIGNPSSCYSGAWSHFVRGISRSITVDLGKVMAVNGFETAFIQNKHDGIFCPQEVRYSISEDGVNYMTAKAVENSVDNTVEEATRVVYNAAADNLYKARYIKVYFDVQVNSFLDEILVFGREDIQGAVNITSDKKEDTPLFYQNSKNIGAKDIVCFHYGYWPKDETLANNKKDVFKPYLGYIDEKGKYVDTMFDSVMFLIIQGNCPSGGKLTSDGGPTIKSDWEYLIDNTFGKDINLDALDQATAELKEELKLPDSHKTTVYLSVPHPKVSDIIFGDFDGDGVDNKISSLDDCVAVYTWYVDKVLERYKEKKYQNIELKGFFWSNESLVSEFYEQEPELAELCVKELHKRNMQCIFIPFYQATGIEKAEKIGFDATIMQANLSFNESLQQNSEKMMENFSVTAKKYHTGIQMELHHSFFQDLPKYAPLYKQYLVSSAKNGMMKDSVHAYYQGAGYGTIYKCAYSNDEFVRWFYDTTYKFIKGSLSFPDFKVNTTTSITTVQNNPFTGTFDIEGDWSNSEYKLSVLKQPQNGNVSVKLSKGEYIYNPDRKFSGNDSFVLKYTDQKGAVVEVPVNVTVTPADGTSSSVSIESITVSNSSIPLTKKGWVYVVIGGIASAAIIAYEIIKKNKK